MDNLMKKLNIDNTLTKPIFYKFPTVKDHIFPKKFYNYQADLLELPTTKLGYRYMLTMIDLWSNYCDFEPLKNKQSTTVLEAMKKKYERAILKKPKATIRTDMGSEFKSVVSQYFFDNSILHLKALPDRHKQLGNIENLNKFVENLNDLSN